MRQFLTWRVWAAFGALVGLTVLLVVLVRADDPLPSRLVRPPIDAPDTPPEHVVDFISIVYQVQPANRFFVLDG
ncbi:MAG TPA: hypothetical protein PLV68_16865, partial [Ilumatobacteraceae bacterium]|nr:hypothetical protein [Ilumatobacteraceae bacterium]